MADVNPVRSNIALPGTQFLAAVSEFIAQSMSGSVNFQNYFAHEQKAFFLNGGYNVGQSTPQVGVDGFAVFEFQAQIIDVWLFNLIAGTSGSTSIDVQIATGNPIGSFASIFTTLPAISYLAGNNVWVGSPSPSLIGPAYNPTAYTPPSNTTQGVLNASNTTTIPAYSGIYCNLQSVQGGSPQNCGIIIHYRPT